MKIWLEDLTWRFDLKIWLEDLTWRLDLKIWLEDLTWRFDLKIWLEDLKIIAAIIRQQNVRSKMTILLNTEYPYYGYEILDLDNFGFIW